MTKAEEDETVRGEEEEKPRKNDKEKPRKNDKEVNEFEGESAGNKRPRRRASGNLTRVPPKIERGRVEVEPPRIRIMVPSMGLSAEESAAAVN